MQNPWLIVDEIDEAEDTDGTSFMGVFNRPPAEIAASLPRPMTPFADAENYSIQSKFVEEYSSSSSCDIESPAIFARSQNVNYSGSLISVF